MLGGEETVARVLGDLEELGVTRVEAGDRIVLASDALTREWPTYAGWLDYRRKFRDASRFWRLNRRPEDLIGDQSVEEAERYHDMDFVEQEFLRESRRRVAVERTTRRRAFAAAGVICIILLSLISLSLAHSSRKSREALAGLKKAAQRRDLAVRVLREKELTEAQLLHVHEQSSSGAVPHERRGPQIEFDRIAKHLADLRHLRAPGPVRPGVSISSRNPEVGAGGSVCCIVNVGNGGRSLLTVNYVPGKTGDQVLPPGPDRRREPGCEARRRGKRHPIRRGDWFRPGQT